MLAWLYRLLVVGFPSRPSVSELRRRVEAVEKTVELFVAEVKEQRGRITTARRLKKEAEEAPSETNDEQPVPGHPPPSTAHLAHRFRSF